MRLNTIFGLLFLVACELGVYQVKYVVRDVKKDVSSLTSQLKLEQQKMHVLDAEWAHLTRPDRLEQLSQAHLGLVPASASQMQADLAVIPVRDLEPAEGDQPQAKLASAETSAKRAPTLVKPVNYAR